MAFDLPLFALDLLILTFPMCFLFLLLVFVLLIESKGPWCSDGEFNPCAIHVPVTLLQGGACSSSISAASWIIVTDDRYD